MEKNNLDKWDKKDRRMAWMNTLTNTVNLITTNMNIGIYKPKDNDDLMNETINQHKTLFNKYLEYEKEPVVGDPKEKDTSDSGFVCSECKKGVSERVKDYSNDNFGKTLCFECQDKEREKNQ